jgi:hypothetical protein
MTTFEVVMPLALILEELDLVRLLVLEKLVLRWFQKGVATFC